MKTILVIEDNENLRENACELLELKGYSTIVAANGKFGIELAIEAKPDLILCDVRMPEMDGFEVINTLKANPATARIPFFFLTAFV